MTEHPAVRLALDWLEDPTHDPLETVVVILGPTKKWVWVTLLEHLCGRTPLNLTGSKANSYLSDEQGPRVVGRSYREDLIVAFQGFHRANTLVILLEYPTLDAETVAAQLTTGSTSRIERFISG